MKRFFFSLFLCLATFKFKRMENLPEVFHSNSTSLERGNADIYSAGVKHEKHNNK